MGNPIGGIVPSGARMQEACVTEFYSPQAWIEGAATAQLSAAAALPGMLDIAAFPDLHPGKYGPTGMAARSRLLHPQLIGNDIGCGMALFELDLATRKVSIDKAAARMADLAEHQPCDPRDELEEAGLPPDLFPDSLGTIGGGNHFCELQTVGALLDAEAASVVDRERLYLLVHSGSRGVGAQVFGQLFERLAAGGLAIAGGTELGSETSAAWLAGHDTCVRWAALNRRMIAARAAEALRCDARLVADMPHNLVRLSDDSVTHYKGAAAVQPNDLAPVAGSRATASYLVRALPGVVDSLGGISHGAGRKYDRATMHGRVGRTRSEREALERNPWGGRLICGDRALVVEEAASAYKDAGKVVADLAAFGLVQPLAEMRPLVTFKKPLADDDTEPRRDGRKNRGLARGGRHGRD